MKIDILTKKLTAIFMVIVMLATIIPVNGIIAATTDITVTIEADKTNVQAGDELTVSVNVPADTNMVGYEFTLDFDKTKLSATAYDTPLTITNGFVDAQIFNDSGKVKIASTGKKSLTAAGTILQVTFEVLTGIAGDAVFDITPVKFIKADPSNENQSIDLTYTIVDNTNVTVEAPLQGIALDKTTLEVNEGETSDPLVVTYNPAYTTSDKTITWNSDDEDVATVVDGKVTGVKAGSATITATASNGKTATCTVTVKAPITSIELDQTTLAINEGESSPALVVTYNPSNTTDEKKVTWKSSDKNIATVEDGVVTGVKAGSATITATTENGKTATCQVEVKAPLVSISLNKSETSLEKNATEILNVVYNPTNTTDDKQATWESSDDSKVKVESTGEGTARITALGVTTTGNPVTITATVGSYTASCDVSVTVPVNGVTITEQNIVLKMPGEMDATLTAVVDPVDALVNSDVAWVSADESIAEVTKTGNNTADLRAVANGTVDIIASIGGKQAKTTVTVITPLQNIYMNVTNAEIKPGQNVELSVTYDPENTTDDKTITWDSSDETYATVDQNGKVTGIKPTTTPVTITARTSNGKSATCEITVLPVPLEGVQISDTSISLVKGTSKSLTAKVLPENTTDSKDITWSSDNETIAKVDENGKVTAVGPGTTYIKAASTAEPMYYEYCEVTVTVPLTGVSLNQTNVTLKRGVPGEDSILLSATPIPMDTTDNTDVTWTSSNETIAKVDVNGYVEAIGPGTAQVTAKIGGFTAICNVTVEVPLQNISIENDDIELYLRQSEVLRVIYDPADTTDSKKIKWESSDPTVVSIDENGKVIAISEGRVYITATSVVDDSIVANATVVAKRMPLNSIALSEATAEMLKGETKTLTVIYNPENTTDEKKVTWKSSDESIAIVDENGNVTALKEGDVTITATSTVNSTLVATCDITVKEINVESVAIKKDSIDEKQLEAGKEFKLTFKLNPEESTDKVDIVWTSSDESIAKIDNEGNVTALKEGKVKFTVLITTEYGETFEDTYELYIKPKKVESISPETGDLNIPLVVIGMILSCGTILFILKRKKELNK